MNIDDDPLAVTRTESLEKDPKRSHKKLSRSVSKPKNTRKKSPLRSFQTAVSQEVMSPVEEIQDKERKAIDYLKELSDIEDAYASNFQEGRKNFGRPQFVEDEMSRAWDTRGRPSRNTSGSPVPILRDLDGMGNSDDHQSPVMAPKFSGLSEKRIPKGGSPSPPRARKIDKGPSYASSGPGIFNKTMNAKPEWPGNGDLEALLKRKLSEKIENSYIGKDAKDNKDDKDNKEYQFTLLEDTALMFAHRKFAQKTMQKLSRGNPRFSAHTKRASMTASSSLRATDGFTRPGDSKETKVMLMTEVVLQGRGLGAQQQTQPQQLQAEKPRVLSNLLRPRSQIERTRTLHALGDMDTMVTEYNKEINAKESLHSIVKGALVAKGHTILRTKEDMLNGGEKMQNDQALVKFWNDIKEMPERGRSNSKTRPSTKEGAIVVSDGREDDKGGKEGTLQLMSTVFPTSWSNKVSSRKFNAGVQGKSVVIIQVPKETRASRKGTHSSEDLDEVFPPKPTRRDSTCRDQTPMRSCTQSADVSMLKIDLAKTSYPMGQQQNQSQLHSLIKPRAHHTKTNERVKNVANLRARLITHEDVLSSIGITQPCLISDNPRILTQETAKSYKKRDYAKRRSRQDAYSIAVSREQSQSTLVMSSMKTKPQMMSLYSWDNYMRKESM